MGRAGIFTLFLLSVLLFIQCRFLSGISNGKIHMMHKVSVLTDLGCNNDDDANKMERQTR